MNGNDCVEFLEEVEKYCELNVKEIDLILEGNTQTIDNFKTILRSKRGNNDFQRKD